MKRLLLTTICLLSVGYSLPVRAQEPSGVDERARGEFIHRDSGTLFKTPPGWKAITPQRLRRDAKTSVMGLERPNDVNVIVNVTYSPLEGRKFSDSVNSAPDSNGEYGEEHTMLTTIYGKDRVSKPQLMQVGGFAVYKIKVESGAFPEDQSVGLVYLFESGLSDKRWKIKVRANVPKIAEAADTEALNSLLNAFSVEGR
ncbi:hypothetical protein KIH39_22080 [Telmatocola sphagniphila]|uniref:Uncharacterized protein n=1 Tax=Telmatocola sphagniphila TaxID=1123043 RepID=A0A8E6EUN6_9BACT|nr:hypothetical protein [Telmatocola sphagniphila]QVL31507.1 hypothetical protein KIH39_22080 [Telmatocola sphagniphila]